MSLHFLLTLHNKQNIQSCINPAFAEVSLQVLKEQIKLTEALLSQHFQTFFKQKKTKTKLIGPYICGNNNRQ